MDHWESLIPLFVLGFLLVFVGLWLGITILLSRIGGWAALAAVYRFPGTFSGERWAFQSAQLRWTVNYRRSLTIGVNADGLFLDVFSLLRIGHPSLFIPWSDISISARKVLGFTYLELQFRQAPDIAFKVNEQLGQRIAAPAGSSWPGVSLFIE